MNRTARLLRTVCGAAALIAFSASSPLAQFDQPTLKCRSAVAKAGTKLAKSTLKALNSCHSDRNRDATLVDTDCNFVASGDLDFDLVVAEAKFIQRVSQRCAGLSPAASLYDTCPTPCNDEVPAIADFADVADCLICLGHARIENFVQVAYGEPMAPLERDVSTCHRALTSDGTRLFNSILKDVTRCQSQAEKDGTTTTDNCTVTTYTDIVADALAKAVTSIQGGKCAGLTLPEAALDACGNAGDTTNLAACVTDSADALGQALATELLGLPETTTTTTSSTTTTTTSSTTTTLPVGDLACPSAAEVVLYSGTSSTACLDNADCAAPRTCDTGLGKCTSDSTVDEGWTGLGHYNDSNDGDVVRLHLYCPGPAGPTCGGCNVLGIDPAPGNCRCANDSRQVCDEPFGLSNECSTTACQNGPLSGESCADDSDCLADGLCSRRCSNDLSTTCTSSAQCPGGTCLSLSDKRCSDGSSCETESECEEFAGTCGAVPGECDCYAGAPTPFSGGGTPFCMVQRHTSNPTGTLDVDSGASAIDIAMRAVVHLGLSTLSPCPTCGGTCSNAPSTFCDRDAECPGGVCNLDPVAGDGVRGGVCSTYPGDDSGLPCDVMAVHTSFPAFPSGPSGGGYSLDCMPATGTNVSGAGLALELTRTTGSAQLDANVSCTGPGAAENCPCLTCSTDRTVACNSDAECSSQPGACSLSNSTTCGSDSDCTGVDAGACNFIGRCQDALSIVCTSNADCDNVNVGSCTASTCSEIGPAAGGAFPLPNNCDGLLCTDLGGGEGECTNGPDVEFCDGVLRANGRGILACTEDVDCSPGVVGVDAGNCTITERLSCFLDPIVAAGTPDPAYPIHAATYCMPPTSNAGVNQVLGLPGPARTRQQTSLTTFCAGDPGTAYTPGVGGCP